MILALGGVGSVVTAFYAYRNKGRYVALKEDFDRQVKSFEVQELANAGIVTANQELRTTVDWLRNERTSDKVDFEKRLAEEQRSCAISLARMEERLRMMEDGFFKSITAGVESAVSQGLAAVLNQERKSASS
jgi:hypothetical protein